MTAPKCPNCAATVADAHAATCAYCGTAFAAPEKSPPTPAEELSKEINGLGCCTTGFLIVAGILWQVGWTKLAIAITVAWLAVLIPYSLYLRRKFGRR